MGLLKTCFKLDKKDEAFLEKGIMLAYTINYLVSIDQDHSTWFNQNRKCILYSALVHALKMPDAMEIFQMLEVSKKMQQFAMWNISIAQILRKLINDKGITDRDYQSLQNYSFRMPND